jgi:hypothetical protein
MDNESFRKFAEEITAAGKGVGDFTDDERKVVGGMDSRQQVRLAFRIANESVISKREGSGMEKVIEEKVEDIFGMCKNILRNNGLDIGSEGFVKKYGKEPMELLRKFIREYIKEEQKMMLEKAMNNKYGNNAFDANSHFEGLARLFHHYGLDFIGYVMDSDDKEKNMEKLGKDFWGRFHPLFPQMCADLEKAIAEHRFKNTAA